MKSEITYQNAEVSYHSAVNSLKQYFDDLPSSNYEVLKLANSYYRWISKKTDLVRSESTFRIPSSSLPNTFTVSAYEWLRTDKKVIFEKYYRFDSDTQQYIINVRKDAIPYEHVDLLMHSLVLTRKSVVWVEFGVNVGSEFGGRHPALILKNLDNSLIVVPLSSQQPESDKYNVKVDSVYGFPPITRWANVTRIHEIDISRIDFSCKIGNVNSKVMNEITRKLHSCGVI